MADAEVIKLFSNTHEEMPDKELDHMAQGAALEAHGLHIAKPEELDKLVLVNVVPSSPIKQPTVVFGGY